MSHALLAGPSNHIQDPTTLRPASWNPATTASPLGSHDSLSPGLPARSLFCSLSSSRCQSDHASPFWAGCQCSHLMHTGGRSPHAGPQGLSRSGPCCSSAAPPPPPPSVCRCSCMPDVLPPQGSAAAGPQRSVSSLLHLCQAFAQRPASQRRHP